MTRWIGSYITRWLMRRPFILSALTGVAQRIKPVWSTRQSTIVLGAAEVNEVFQRGDCFELGPVGRDKMLSGEFLLGMDAWPVYVADKQAIVEVLEKCERKHLHAIAVRHSRITCERLKERLADASQARRQSFHIDIVTDVAEPVVMGIATEFFLGLEKLPPLTSQLVAVQKNDDNMDASQQIFCQWLRKVGSVIVDGYPAPFGLQTIAKKMSGELNAFLEERCRELVKSQLETSRGRQPTRYQDVVTGLAGKFVVETSKSGYLSDELVDKAAERTRRNLAGLLVAGSTPLIHSIAVAIDQLLKHKDQLTEPLAAIDVDPHAISFMSSMADDPHFSSTTVSTTDICFEPDDPTRTMHPAASDMSPIDLAHEYIVHAERDDVIATLGFRRRDLNDEQWQRKKVFKRMQLQMIDLVYEAMRFNTTFPFIARYSPRDDVIGPPEGPVCPVAAGATVVASQLAAMHDSRVFPKPETFAYRRRNTYMHFGAGDHACLGKSIASKIIAHVVADLLTIPEVVSASPGRLRFDGPAVKGYRIEYEHLDKDAA